MTAVDHPFLAWNKSRAKWNQEAQSTNQVVQDDVVSGFCKLPALCQLLSPSAGGNVAYQTASQLQDGNTVLRYGFAPKELSCRHAFPSAGAAGGKSTRHRVRWHYLTAEMLPNWIPRQKCETGNAPSLQKHSIATASSQKPSMLFRRDIWCRNQVLKE